MPKTLTIATVAKKIGVHPLTLRRWLLAGKITGIAKNRNGWWVFEPKDIEKILQWKDYRYIPEIKKKV